MKLKTPRFLWLLILSLIYFGAFSQIDPETNCLLNTNYKNLKGNSQPDLITLDSVSALSCSDNTFWAINDASQIKKFVINGNSINYDNVTLSGISGTGLAICNNINGGTMSPTFYTTNYSNNSVLYYNGGTSWINALQLSPSFIYNGGGNGNDLYFNEGGSSLPSKITKYDGATFSAFYSWDSLYNAVADICVDADGNIWCVKGNPSFPSQFIDVISPSGSLIKRLNFDINNIGAYGSFILNNKLYLGLGNGNPIYPNSLIPVTFSLDSAYIGTPLLMPTGNWLDLASCNIGVPLSTSNTEIISDIKIYPNPMTENVTINLKNNSKENNTSISIYDTQGQLLLKERILQLKTELNISALEKGVYIIKINYRDKQEVKRLIKE